jgi:hypothetical protein
MCKTRLGILLVLLLGMVAAPSVSVQAQNFGGAFQRKRIVLVRKLPPTGHIDGTSIRVLVTGAGADVTSNLQATIENLLVNNDSRLRTASDKETPDALITCRVTTYSQPPPQRVTEANLAIGKKGAPFQNEPMNEVTGLLTTTFQAQDARSHKSIAADTITSKFDREYLVPAAPTAKPSVGSILGSHLPKLPGTGAVPGTGVEDKQPTPEELRDRLIHDTALQIASRLVNTSESVDVYLATGGGLDEANKLMDQKLWTRALEQLETMTPFPQPDQDAYRLYNVGVVNEALGYQAEDVGKARKYLQEASIDYGKAIDAKPTEKNFLQPQTRIDTALAHYKTLGNQMAASAQSATAAAAAASAAPDALTNADVISMVAAKLDEANILDTIKTSSAVKFDLSAKGQIDLAKGNVNGRIIAAMKQKSRGQ